MMKCRQITTFCADGEAIVKEQVLPVTREADEPVHLESGVINLYPEITYQEIEGFGCAITETSAYLLSEMEEAARRDILQKFFGKDGSRLHFIRTHIDSCDYSLEEYQAVKDPLQDPELLTFSLERDRKYILPVLKEALDISRESGNGEMAVLLSPWSPPYQWKTPPARPKNDAGVYGGPGHEMKVDYTTPSRNNGGSLKPEYYGSWAKYLVKYIQAYLDEGVPVTMLTMQNESIAATNWDSCVWTAEEQKTFLKEFLYPEMKRAGLAEKVGIYIWDHNKERVLEWALDMIDAETAEMIQGIAFHWYSGDHFEAVQMTHEKFPDKVLMLSECCGLHAPGQGSFWESMGLPKTKTPMHAEADDAGEYAHDIIGNLNAGMNRWIDWNLCVDETGGPRHIPNGFTASCIVENGSARLNMTYYYVKHFSRYILPGARRIGVSRCDQKTEVTAAKNPDGSVAVVVLNRGNEDAFYAFRVEGCCVRFGVPAGTISTLVLEQ